MARNSNEGMTEGIAAKQTDGRKRRRGKRDAWLVDFISRPRDREADSVQSRRQEACTRRQNKGASPITLGHAKPPHPHLNFLTENGDAPAFPGFNGRPRRLPRLPNMQAPNQQGIGAAWSPDSGTYRQPPPSYHIPTRQINRGVAATSMVTVLSPHRHRPRSRYGSSHSPTVSFKLASADVVIPSWHLTQLAGNDPADVDSNPR